MSIDFRKLASAPLFSLRHCFRRAVKTHHQWRIAVWPSQPYLVLFPASSALNKTSASRSATAAVRPKSPFNSTQSLPTFADAPAAAEIRAIVSASLSSPVSISTSNPSPLNFAAFRATSGM